MRAIATSLVKIEDEEIGLLIEVKYAQRGELDSACKKALQQIRGKRIRGRA